MTDDERRHEEERIRRILEDALRVTKPIADEYERASRPTAETMNLILY